MLIPAKLNYDTQKTMEQSIRSVMLLYAAMVVSVDQKTPANLREDLRSQKVWTAAQ